MKKLTVAIPTYNRAKALEITLTCLMQQLTSECELLIIDNCSNDETQKIIEQSINAFKVDAEISITRNLCNVGGNENILRCIEWAKGDYVWLLGDDDFPTKDAIKTILEKINENPDTKVFNYYYECSAHQTRKEDHKTVGSVEYLNYTKSLGELVFISNLVISRIHAIVNINEAHLWQSSHVPQLIVTAVMLRNKGEALFSKSTLVTRILSEQIMISHGSILPIAVGIGSLLHPQWTREEVTALQKLELWFNVYTIINQLILFAANGTDKIGIAKNYRKNILDSICFKPINKFQKFILYLSYVFIKYPHFGLFIRKLIYTVKQKKDVFNIIVDHKR